MKAALNGKQTSVHEKLEYIFLEYHKPEFIHPDPLEFVWNFDKPDDREIVGLISSCLALGRVNCILRSINEVLRFLPSPKQNLLSLNLKEIRYLLKNFRYRFFTGEHIAQLLWGIRRIIVDFDTLENCFGVGLNVSDENIIPAVNRFVRLFGKITSNKTGMLLSLPEKGSACKRLNLFLRWMVRKDSIDPGGWDTLSPSQLIIPLDTHMLKFSKILGFTQRKQADLKTALEVTQSFQGIDPDDPVRFDFSLTRLGILKIPHRIAVDIGK